MAGAHGSDLAAVTGDAAEVGGPVQVFISYAHDDQAHESRVRDFWVFLRANGVDARLDLVAAEQRVDWAKWMTREVRDAGRVLVIASPEYKKRAEGDAGPAEGRGVQWEARLIRDLFYADQEAGLQRFLPVVLPGCSADDIPLWLAPASATFYQVSEYTMAGAEKLLRLLTGQPGELMPPLGPVPALSPHGGERGLTAAPQRPGLHTEVVIEAAISPDGVVASAVWVAGSLLSARQQPLPPEVSRVWAAPHLPAAAAGDRIAEAGRQLADVLLADDDQMLLGALLERLPAGDSAGVVLCASGEALSLPVELVRLRSGSETEPLALLAGVSVTRRVAAAGRELGTPPCPPSPPPPAGLPGPLKVLAAVAAPDETKTRNAALDTEAEMAAVLDAVAGITGSAGGQVRILEVASLPAIRQALEADAFHVLHLSAHGSAGSVELEDEDGAPVEVTTGKLVQALKRAGRAIPLIVLSFLFGRGSRQPAAGGRAGGAGRGPGAGDARPGHRRLRDHPRPPPLRRAGDPAGADRGTGAGPGPLPDRGAAIPSRRGTVTPAGVRGGHAADGGRGRPADRPRRRAGAAAGGDQPARWHAGPRPADGHADRPPRPSSGHHGHPAAYGSCGGPVRGRQRGDADRGRRDRQDRGRRAGDLPAARRGLAGRHPRGPVEPGRPDHRHRPGP